MLWPTPHHETELRCALQEYVASARDVRRVALDTVTKAATPEVPADYSPEAVAQACIVAAQQAVSVARNKK